MNQQQQQQQSIDSIILDTQDIVSQSFRTMKMELIARYNKIVELEAKVKELEAKQTIVG